MKKYSTFLFDFDGTLLDSNNHVISCFKKAFMETVGYAPTDAEITATFGIPLAKALRDLNPEHAEEILDCYRKHSDALGFSLLRSFEGARDLLKGLKEKGATVAIVTGKKEINAAPQMAFIGIDAYVDLLVGPERTVLHKPNPAPIEFALEALGAQREDAIMIGDSPNDILCGKNAQVDTMGVRFTALPLELLLATEPDYMVDDLADILDFAR